MWSLLLSVSLMAGPAPAATGALLDWQVASQDATASELRFAGDVDRALIPAVVPRPFALVGSVTGRVTDARTGQPIPSAQIYIAALDLGTLSNDEGRYLLQNVPDGTHTIRAELIGYETVTTQITVTPGGTVVHDFRLAEQALAMDEIVVTGVPGGTRVRAIGNAVGSLDAAGVTEKAAIADVQSVLRGRTPSVNMMGGGQVGVAPRMRIRGASTFSLDGQPLVYIDGVRANNEETSGYAFGNNAGVRGILSSLDPEQIEKIEVLKGPAAATLYGTEASRGVVNIITKRGREGRARVDLTIRQGFNYLANPVDKVGYENYWRDPSTNEVYSLNMVDHMNALGREIFTYGPVQSYSGNLSGGSQDTQYFFSTTYSREEGVYSWNWAKRLNLRTNIDTRLADNLGLNVNMGYTNSRDRIATDGFSSIIEGLEFGSPRFLPEHRCRTNPGFGCDVFEGVPVVGVPVRDRSLENHQDLDRFSGGATFTFTPVEWLTTRLTTGVDYTGQLDVALREFQTNDTALASLGAVGARGFRNEARTSTLFSTTDLSGTADWRISPTLTSATSVGAQYYTRTISFLSAGGQQFAGPGLSTITATAIQDTPQNNRVGDNTLGFYVQETLGWRDRLFLTGAVRVDNNSAFGSDIDLVTYPKASLSWVMNEEGWWEDVAPSWLNGFRLRLAWGQSGEQPASFSALRTWTPVTGPQGTAGVTPNTVGNPDLTAEIGEETEVGFDSELIDSRLGLQFTYYHKLTKGAILQRDLPPSGGFTGQQFVNAGRIVNDGLELALNARMLERQGFSWDMGFNMSYNDSEILQLSGEPGDTTIVFNSWSSMEHRVGHAPFSWFGVDVVSAELDANGRATNALCNDGRGGTTPCFDAGGNTIAPRLDLGRAIAPWEFSLSTDVSLGDNLSFHALFTSEQGHKRFDNTLRQRCRLYSVCRENAFPEEWDPIMQATVQSSDQIIDSWVNDVSFIRLKELSMTYDIPRRFIEGYKMSRAVWQVSARNLLTFTDWTAGDPEVMFSSGGRMFMYQNNIPLPQQITTSIRVSF
ncbi:MAG: SusC/RagA family TonB-linked outer membrane protein [Gemmatimonadota bacterium]